jgi:putative folate metabolism gamma-glutamate ligase
MQVTAYPSPLVRAGDNLYDVLSQTLVQIPEGSVVAITSKIIALSENRVVDKDSISKHDLVRQEADQYTEPHSSKYDMMLAVKNHQLFVNAGIDESNADGKYVLWPSDPQRSANRIWEWLRLNFGVQRVGVIITDSKTAPLHWGVTGASIAHCGFRELNSKIGEKDLFGRELHMTQVNVSQALAAAAVFEMGEASEGTPVALIENIRDIEFQDRPPTAEELDSLKIELEDDVYAPILTQADWQSGRRI